MDIGKTTIITGKVLAILLFLVCANSTYYFLGIAKVRVIEWLMFNACVPASIAQLIGFTLFMLTGNKTALGTGILPMVFFGTMGLVIFPWGGMANIAQAGHIIMTLNVVWSLYVTIKLKDYKALAVGLLIGLIIYVPFIAYEQYYCRTHASDLQRILQIE